MNSSGFRRAGHILDTLWYAGSAAETLMTLLALLAVTLGVSAIFPQLPDGLQGATADRWLASTAANYAGTGQFLRQVGVFTVSQSAWLRVLLAALVFNVALRLAIQASALARLIRHRRGSASAAQSPSRHQPSTIPQTAGPLLAYAGMLILVGGLFVNSLIGWQATGIALAPGSSVPMGPAGRYWLSLEELAGSEANPVARIGLASGQDAPPDSMSEISAGRPVRGANLWIALRAAGAALQATARDARGRPLLLQSLEPGLQQGEVSEELHLLFRQTQAEQEFALPSANLSFRVVSYPSLPEKGIETPVFLVEAYRGDDPAPVLSDLVVDQAILVLDGTTLELVRDRYAIVDASYMPGLMLFFLGGLAILAGVSLSLYSRRPTATDAMARADGAALATPQEGGQATAQEPNHAA
jgi:hypothetical protein